MVGLEKDTGWAWVVLAASTASLFIFVVLSASVGFFQVEIMEDLGVGAGPISIMSALALGQSCVLGPLSGILSSLLSVRVTVYLGVSLYSGGLVLSSFCQSLASLTFFFGILTGFGFGIAYTATVVVISLHFERHRLLASGVIMCAPGLGLLSIPHVISWALAAHGWRWTCTMVGGFVLHVAILATVYFPTDTERQTMVKFDEVRKKLVSRLWGDKSHSVHEGNILETTENCAACHYCFVENDNCEADRVVNKQSMQNETDFIMAESEGVVDKENSGNTTVDSGLEADFCQAATLQKSEKDISTLSNLSIDFPEFISREDKRSFNLANHILRLDREQSFQGSFKSLPLTFKAKNGVIECLSSPRLASNTKHCLDLNNHPQHSPSNVSVNTNTGYSAAFLNASEGQVQSQRSPCGLPRKRSASSVSHNSYRSLSQYQASPRHRGSNLLRKSRSWIHSQTDIVGSFTLLPVQVEEIKMDTCPENERSVRENIHIVLHCKLVWMLGLTSFCFIFGFGMNTVHFPSFAEQQGVPRDSISQFYTAQGLVVMVARLGGGILLNGFKSKPPLAMLLIVLQTVMGLIQALAPFYATGVTGLYVMQVGMAMTYGVGYMLFAPICVQMLGVDLLAISFGLVQLFIGSGYILAPIIAGFIYDITGTFDVPLMLGGSVITVGVLPLAVMTCFPSCKARSTQSTQEVEATEQETENGHMLEQDTN